MRSDNGYARTSSILRKSIPLFESPISWLASVENHSKSLRGPAMNNSAVIAVLGGFLVVHSFRRQNSLSATDRPQIGLVQ